jgi:N,N'-diacetylchitobiose transport system permease protein
MVQSKLTRALERFATHTVLLVFCALFLFPVAYTLMTSLKSKGEVLTRPPTFFPSQIRLESYETVFNSNMVRYHIPNTLINSLGSSVLTIVIATLAGYTFSRYRFRGSRVLQLAILGLIMIPGITNLIPLYRMASDFKALNTHEFIILVYTAGGLPFSIWIIKSFLDAIPIELEEAAFIDGCTPLEALRRVVAPLAAPGILAAFMLMFVDTWNEFLAALVLISQETAKTATVGLYAFQTSFETAYHVWTAACILIMVPALLVFLLLHRTFFEAMLQGAVKG